MMSLLLYHIVRVLVFPDSKMNITKEVSDKHLFTSYLLNYLYYPISLIALSIATHNSL